MSTKAVLGDRAALTCSGSGTPGFQPLALAIVVQTGGAGAAHLADYQGLGAILDAILGTADHLVAVVSFDATAHLLQPFTADSGLAARRLNSLQAGDNGAAILDVIAFAIAQLRQQPPNYRHAILLLSETIDQSIHPQQPERPERRQVGAGPESNEAPCEFGYLAKMARAQYHK